MKNLTITAFLLVACILTSFRKDEGKKPKAVYRSGDVNISVWENTYTGKNGEFTSKSFNVQKSYLKDGEWKYTNNFFESDLADLQKALNQAIAEEKVKID